MSRTMPIKSVMTLDGHLLQVTFHTGNCAVVDLKPHLQSVRFRALSNQEIWETADTNGGFIHWYQSGFMVVELAWNEVVEMLLGEWV